MKSKAIHLMLRDIGVFQLDSLEQQQEIVETIAIDVLAENDVVRNVENTSIADVAVHVPADRIDADDEVEDASNDSIVNPPQISTNQTNNHETDGLGGSNNPYIWDVRYFGQRLTDSSKQICNCSYFLQRWGRHYINASVYLTNDVVNVLNALNTGNEMYRSELFDRNLVKVLMKNVFSYVATGRPNVILDGEKTDFIRDKVYYFDVIFHEQRFFHISSVFYLFSAHIELFVRRVNNHNSDIGRFARFEYYINAIGLQFSVTP